MDSIQYRQYCIIRFDPYDKENLELIIRTVGRSKVRRSIAWSSMIHIFKRLCIFEESKKGMLYKVIDR